jgi:hypothetical protein
MLIKYMNKNSVNKKSLNNTKLDLESKTSTQSMSVGVSPIEIGTSLFTDKLNNLKQQIIACDNNRKGTLHNLSDLRNNLPVYRIKRIMKTNPDVRVIRH